MTTKKQAWKPWNGFAIEIKPDTELGGYGLLIAEYESGAYEPIGPVVNVNEARETAADDAKHRRARGGDPVVYKLWARGVEGRYLTVPVVIEGGWEWVGSKLEWR